MWPGSTSTPAGKGIVGFTVDAAYGQTDQFAGRPLVEWEELERHFPPERVKLLQTSVSAA